MMNKQLGICITTFNRAEVLKDVLDIMVPLARRVSVAIYVNDNASTDKTIEVLEHFRKEYEFFFPYIQSTNVGFDVNYAHCMRRCEAAYCWGMADYSLVKEDAIVQLLDIIATEEYDFIALNNSSRVSYSTKDKYTKIDDVIQDIAWHITLLDCVVWSKKAVNQANFERYYGSLFGYYGAMFEYLSTHPFKMKWEQATYITAAHPKKRSLWYARAIDTWCVKWTTMVMSLPYALNAHQKFALIQSHSRHSGLFSLKSLLSLRAENYLRYDMLRADARCISTAMTPQQVFLATLVCAVPHGVLKVFKTLVLRSS